MSNNVTFTRKAELIDAMRAAGWYTQPLTLSRIEEGKFDFHSTDSNGVLFNVIIKLETLEGFMDLDVTEDDSLQDLVTYDQLCVRSVDKGVETIYFDSIE